MINTEDDHRLTLVSGNIQKKTTQLSNHDLVFLLIESEDDVDAQVLEFFVIGAGAAADQLQHLTEQFAVADVAQSVNVQGSLGECGRTCRECEIQDPFISNAFNVTFLCCHHDCTGFARFTSLLLFPLPRVERMQ